MYETPKLEKYGTFRALTLKKRYPYSTAGKVSVGVDTAPGWGGGLDCDPDPNDIGACRS